jgi:hypothetical protein
MNLMEKYRNKQATPKEPPKHIQKEDIIIVSKDDLEPAYTAQEMAKIKDLTSEELEAINRAKSIFPNAKVEQISMLRNYNWGNRLFPKKEKK